MKYRSALPSLIDMAVRVLLSNSMDSGRLSHTRLVCQTVCTVITSHLINDQLTILAQLRFRCATNPLPVMDLSPTNIEQLFREWLETAQYLHMPKVIQDSRMYINYIVGAYHPKIHTN